MKGRLFTLVSAENDADVFAWGMEISTPEEQEAVTYCRNTVWFVTGLRQYVTASCSSGVEISIPHANTSASFSALTRVKSRPFIAFQCPDERANDWFPNVGPTSCDHGQVTKRAPFLRRRLGRRLREIREGANFTLTEAAKRLDKTRSALQRIETGVTRADVHFIRSFMDVCDHYDEKLIDEAREAMKPPWFRAYGIEDMGYVDVETY